MDNVFFLGAIVAIAATVASLFIGLFSMGGGTEKAQRISNKMMRMRVFFQGLAIVMLLMAYLTKH